MREEIAISCKKIMGIQQIQIYKIIVFTLQEKRIGRLYRHRSHSYRVVVTGTNFWIRPYSIHNSKKIISKIASLVV